MKAGWMKGALAGALMGASAVAMFTAMNQDARRKMMNTVGQAAHKTASKAQQMMNQSM